MVKSIAALLSLLFFSHICAAKTGFNQDLLMKGDWNLATSSNFEVTTDLDRETASALVQDLENYRIFLIQILRLDIIDTGKKLKILAISQDEHFANLGMPEKWAGLFSTRVDGYAAIANIKGYKKGFEEITAGRQILFHEYNHYLRRFSRNTSYLPLWYEEGAAEYYGAFRLDNKKITLGDLKVISRRAASILNSEGKIAVETEKIFKLKSLDMKSDSNFVQRQVSELYAKATFIMHYMNSSPELRNNLAAYIDYVNDGYTEDEGVTMAFGMDFSALDKAIQNYLNHDMKVRVIDVKGQGFEFPQQSIKVIPLSKSELTAQLSYVLVYMGVLSFTDLKSLVLTAIELNGGNDELRLIAFLQKLLDSPGGFDRPALSYGPTLNYFENMISPPSAFLSNYKADGVASPMKIQRIFNKIAVPTFASKACAFYKKAIEKDPFNISAQAGYGMVLAEVPTNNELTTGVTGLYLSGHVVRREKFYREAAYMAIRADLGLDSLAYLKRAFAYAPNKSLSPLVLPKENLAILYTINTYHPKSVNQELIYEDGSRYIGQFHNLIPQGKGKFIRPNGTLLEGYFKNGKPEGQGWLNTRSGFNYDGHFSNGIAKGAGKIYYPSGFRWTSYEGNVNYAVPFGQGVASTAMTKYQGEFFKGQINGKGSVSIIGNSKKLEGDWVDGRFVWPLENGIYFTGGFDLNARRNGIGYCITEKLRNFSGCTYASGVKTNDLSVSDMEAMEAN